MAVGHAVQIWGVGKVGSCLGQGQRQVPQIGRQAGELLTAFAVFTGLQGGGEVGHSLGGSEQADSDQAAARASQGGVLTAGSHQRAARWAGGRPQAPQVGRVGHIVQNDQPPALLRRGLRLQPGEERFRCQAWITCVVVKDLPCRLGVRVGNRLAGSGGNPHQQVHVFFPGTSSMVGGKLSLANPTHTSKHLAQHCGTCVGDCLSQLPDRTAVLERISLPGQYPDLVRPRHRLTWSGVEHHTISAADRDRARPGMDRCMSGDVQGRRGAGPGQPWNGPGCGGFPRVTSPMRKAAADPWSARRFTFPPTASPLASADTPPTAVALCSSSKALNWAAASSRSASSRLSSSVTNIASQDASCRICTRSASAVPAADKVAAVWSKRSSSAYSRRRSPRPNHVATRCRKPAQASVPAACTTALPPAAANAAITSASTPPSPLSRSCPLDRSPRLALHAAAFTKTPLKPPERP